MNFRYFTGIRKKECVRRRRLGRNPRIPFSTEQVAILEKKFRTSPYLSNSDVAHLSKCLQLSESRVSISKFLPTTGTKIRFSTI